MMAGTLAREGNDDDRAIWAAATVFELLHAGTGDLRVRETLRPSIRLTLRLGNRALRAFMPERLHSRMARAAMAAVIEYQKADLDGIDTGRSDSLPGERDKLAEPLAPFIGCDGTRIEPGPRYLERLEAVRQDCDLVLCCAFTGRHRIVERIVEESFAGDEAENIRWLLTGSTLEDGALIDALAARTRQVAGFVVENRPLGRKWQTCLYTATRYFDAEIYGITGSDDFVSNRLVDRIIRRHRANVERAKNPAFLPAMYCTLEWVVCQVDSGISLVPQIIKCSYKCETAFQPLGSGRFYTHAFLDECKGLIFESDKESQLDDRGYFEVRDRGRPIEYYTVEDGPLVSVKGNWDQMNPIGDLLAAPTLELVEFSFAGRELLGDALSEASNKYLFGPATLSPQVDSARLADALDRPEGPQDSHKLAKVVARVDEAAQ